MRGRGPTLAAAFLTLVLAIGATTAPGTRARPPLHQAGLAHPAWWHDEYNKPASDRAFPEIRATGARWVVLVPTWYQRRASSSSVARDRRKTVTDAGLGRAIARARRAGLKVLLKPHVDLVNDDLDRATIRPRSLDAWFSSYTRFIAHYAQLARRSGVAELSVGTELAGVSGHTDRWRRVIAAVRRAYHGPLVYAANYDEYRGIGFWDALDLIGVDAYWPLSSAPTTDVGRLRRSWAPIAARLAGWSRRWHRPVLFTEAGYVSQVGTTTAPYDWTISGRRSDAEQAAAYRALLSVFWGRSWFAGVHWWMWDDLPGSGEDQRLDYTPHRKAAERVLRQFFR